MALLTIFIVAPIAGIVLAWRLGIFSVVLVYATAFAGELIAVSAYRIFEQYRITRLMATPHVTGLVATMRFGPQPPRGRCRPACAVRRTCHGGDVWRPCSGSARPIAAPIPAARPVAHAHRKL